MGLSWAVGETCGKERENKGIALTGVKGVKFVFLFCLTVAHCIHCDIRNAAT